MGRYGYDDNQFDHAGFLVVIDQDTDCPNPREDQDGYLAVLALYHNRYLIGDSTKPEMDELPDILNQPGTVSLPVWGYDHGGLALMAGSRTGQFADPWDSGQAGIAYVTRESWQENMGWKRLTQKRRAFLKQAIQGEVEEYTSWIQGECYGYRILVPPAYEDEDVDVDDLEHVESCWGFIGYEVAVEAAKEAAEDAASERSAA